MAGSDLLEKGYFFSKPKVAPDWVRVEGPSIAVYVGEEGLLEHTREVPWSSKALCTDYGACRAEDLVSADHSVEY